MSGIFSESLESLEHYQNLWNPHNTYGTFGIFPIFAQIFWNLVSKKRTAQSFTNVWLRRVTTDFPLEISRFKLRKRELGYRVIDRLDFQVVVIKKRSDIHPFLSSSVPLINLYKRIYKNPQNTYSQFLILVCYVFGK